MPDSFSGFRYVEAQFDKHARPVGDAGRQALTQLLADGSVTDLVVLAHGWNNDMPDARRLFERIAASLAAVQADGHGRLPAGRQLALLGVVWPSKKFAESDLIPGGAASFGDADSEAAVLAQLEELKGVFDAADADDRLEEAKALVPQLEDSATARARFAELVQSVLPAGEASEEDASDAFFAASPEELFDQLDNPTVGDIPLPAEGGVGGAAALDGASSPGGFDDAGAAAGWGFLGKKAAAAKNLLNYATYYQMKARAGKVGSDGLAPLLRSVVKPSVRVHLVGHSFGGRLVTAAAASPGGLGGRLSSLALLQAAFSHYGFADDWKPGTDGAFRSVLTSGRLSGPVLVTHTRNDKAVGIAYALASRIARQVGAEVGGPGDKYGGIGANGAQKTPGTAALQLQEVGKPYAFTAGKLHNLKADRFVADHGSVSGREVAWAVLSAVAAS
jgi:hypothetical protein